MGIVTEFLRNPITKQIDDNVHFLCLVEFGGQAVPEPEAYLEKPAEPEELAETIKKVLG